MTVCWFDYETFNELDLKQYGLGRYARHPSLEVLMVSWSLDHGATIGQYDRFRDGDRLPNELLDALEDDRITKAAWNFAFERTITKQALGIDVPTSDAFDPMVVARALSMPGALSDVCKILNLPEADWKQEGGRALINFWCKPRKPTKTNPNLRNYPSDNAKSREKWDRFLAYNVQDIRAMVRCWDRMRKWTLSEDEWEMWELDREINEAGIPINLKAVRNANRIVDALTEKALAELTEVTGLDNANSGEQLLGWLKPLGYPFNDMKIGHVRRALQQAVEDGEGDTGYARALELRTHVSKASLKKYAAYENMTCDDGLLYDMHVFGGAARTQRWSGSGLQHQNLARPHWYFETAEAQERLANNIRRCSPETFEWIYSIPDPKNPGGRPIIDPFEALSSGVRGPIAAPDGYALVGADFNAIENRVLGYMADEERILDVFREDRCPYVDFATYMFGGSYDELWHEYKVLKMKTKRQIAKPGVLGCGYMLSEGFEYEDEATGELLATGLLGYARGMGIDLTPEQSATSVKVWRATYSKVSDPEDGLWYSLDRAVRKCITTGRRTECQMFEFEKDGPFMTARLPSGRKLFYLRPRIEDRKTPWGAIRPTVTYEGVDSRSSRKAWGRISTHPGKITENLYQAIARDCLRDALKRMRRRMIGTRIHVHDEAVTLVREDKAEWVAKIMSEEMSRPMDWAPELPLKAVAEISKIFVKT